MGRSAWKTAVEIGSLVRLLFAGLTAGAAAWAWLGEHNALAALSLGGFALSLLAYAVYYISRLRPLFAIIGGSGVQAKNSKAFRLRETNLPGGQPRTQAVSVLEEGSEQTGTIKLNWATFLHGCERLALWADGHVHPNVYVGINPAGAVIANYIASELGNDGAKILVCRTFPGHGLKNPDDVPSCGTMDVGDILVVDSQIKTGLTSDGVIEVLEKRHPKARIWFVSLVICGVYRESLADARHHFHRDETENWLTVSDLLTTESNRYVRELGRSPTRIPHGVAFAAEYRVLAPRNMR